MPKAKPTDAELEELAQRALHIIRFIYANAPATPGLTGFEHSIESAAARRDARGLRQVNKDFKEWAAGLSAAFRQQLDEQLRQKFGAGL